MTADAPPRLAPVPPERWGDDARDALRLAFPAAVVDRFSATGADAVEVPAVLGTLLHHPALAGPFLAYNNVLLQHPVLDARLRELMILRVAWRTRARYEWAQHARLASKIGITPGEIEAVTIGAKAPGWSPLEADALAATDELVDGYRVEDATWARLAAQLDARRLVELVFVVGTYTGLAMAFNSFGLQLDADLAADPATSLHVFEE